MAKSQRRSDGHVARMARDYPLNGILYGKLLIEWPEDALKGNTEAYTDLRMAPSILFLGKRLPRSDPLMKSSNRG